MDSVACKLPGIISPLLNRAPEAAAAPPLHTIENVTQISERVEKLRLSSGEQQCTKGLTAPSAAASPDSSRSGAWKPERL